MQFSITSVFLALGLATAVAAESSGDAKCYWTLDSCTSQNTNSACTGCKYYSTEKIPYCCIVS